MVEGLNSYYLLQPGQGNRCYGNVSVSGVKYLLTVYSSATIINHLQSSIQSPDSPVLFYFCNYKDQDEKHATLFLISLALQLASQSAECLAIVFRRHKEKKGETLGFTDYFSLVETYVSKHDSVYIIVDALDEVARQDPQEQEAFVSVLNQLLSSTTDIRSESLQPDYTPRGTRKIIMASRDNLNIAKSLGRQSKHYCMRLNLHDSDINADLEKYVNGDLQRRIELGKLRLRDGRLAAEIQAKIIRLAGT